MNGILRSPHGRERRQTGNTTLGLIMLLALIAIVAFAALRLTPVYLNYMKVVGVVDGVVEEFDGHNPTRAVIRNSVSRRFNVESVSAIDWRNITITAVSGGFEVAAIYDHPAPFIGNISFLVHFDKTVIVRR